MKQHVTKEQFLELGKHGPRLWGDKFGDYYSGKNRDEMRGFKFPDIGKMIEYLGDYFAGETEDEYYFTAKIDTAWKDWEGTKIEPSVKMSWSGELCDCLWEAVKYKMKKEISI